MNVKIPKPVITIFVSIIVILAIVLLFRKEAKTSGGLTKDGKYILKFSDDFKKGLATEDNLGLSILLVVDCSGSMYDAPKDGSSYDSKYVLASQSLTEIVNFLEAFYNKNLKNDNIILKIGIIKFDNKVTDVYALQEMNQYNFSDLKKITSEPTNFNPDGSTAIGLALERGSEILSQSQTIFKSLILITDGENTSGVTPDKVLSAIVEDRNNKSTEDFPIFTNSILVSFVGFDVESYVFKDLAKIGSRVTSASNKDELIESLKKIFLADITKLEAK
ncbi:MAG TPA: vWA domain-containing protein [Spirochaetota bacterium]|nr:vWA domain-containing protein [Spirochaetota bacterium]